MSNIPAHNPLAAAKAKKKQAACLSFSIGGAEPAPQSQTTIFS
jgi:hypothetical protein